MGAPRTRTCLLGFWMMPDGIMTWKKKRIDAILNMNQPKHKTADALAFTSATINCYTPWPSRSIHVLALPPVELTGRGKFEWTPCHTKSYSLGRKQSFHSTRCHEWCIHGLFQHCLLCTCRCFTLPTRHFSIIQFGKLLNDTIVKTHCGSAKLHNHWERIHNLWIHYYPLSHLAILIYVRWIGINWSSMSIDLCNAKVELYGHA